MAGFGEYGCLYTECKRGRLACVNETVSDRMMVEWLILLDWKVEEAGAAGQSIYRYDKNRIVVNAYMSFIKNVVRDGERQRN